MCNKKKNTKELKMKKKKVSNNDFKLRSVKLCFDNGPAELFFHTLKVEEVYGQAYETRKEVKSCILGYIEIFYNCKRKHSFLGLVSLWDFEYRYSQKLRKISVYKNKKILCIVF